MPKDFLLGITVFFCVLRFFGFWTRKLSSATGLKKDSKKKIERTRKNQSLARNVLPKDFLQGIVFLFVSFLFFVFWFSSGFFLVFGLGSVHRVQG